MDLNELLNAFSKLPEYGIEIGVMSQNKKRKVIQVNVGVTNAELMFIHENGSPLRHIPARPVLQMTIDYTNKNLLQSTLDKATTVFIDANFDVVAFEKELTKLCIKMENYARELIYSNDGRLASNAPSTIKRKGANHPLFDTGQLARSITCKLIRL